MKGRAPTPEEQEFMDKIGALGCIVCREFERVYSPASIHHMDGRIKTGCHFHVLPLCGSHHQIPDVQKPKRWISRHGDGKKQFENNYWTEQELYHKCLMILQNARG